MLRSGRFTLAQVGVSLVGVILCYSPLYLDVPVTFELDKLQNVISSPEFQDPAKMSLAITFPMMVNCVFEIKDLSKRNLDAGRYCIQWLYVLTLLLPNVLLLLFKDSVRTEVYLCSIQSRDALFYGALVSLLATQKHGRRYDQFLLGINISIQILLCAYSWWNVSAESEAFEIVLLLVSIILYCLIISACVRFGLLVNRNKLPSYEILVAQSLLVLILNSIVRWVLFAFVGDSLSSEDFSKRMVVAFSWTDLVTYTITFALNSRAIRAEATALEEKLRQNKTFVAHISHEMRTPLNAISVGMQLLCRRVSAERVAGAGGAAVPLAPALLRDSYEELCCINISTQTALQMLNEILMFDKLESKNLVLEHQFVSVGELIRLVASAFKLQASMLDITLSYDGEDNIPEDLDKALLYIDISKFAQVLRNFVSNALKFTRASGKVTIRARTVEESHEEVPEGSSVADTASTLARSQVSFHSYPDTVNHDAEEEPVSDNTLFRLRRLFAHGGQSVVQPVSSRLKRRIRIEVEDTGVGISKQNMSRLFTEGVQFDAASLQGGGGSGLGLWIAKMITQLHGGSVGAISTVGVGSCFFVELPEHELTDESKRYIDRSHSTASAADITPIVPGMYENPWEAESFDMSPSEMATELPMTSGTMTSHSDAFAYKDALRILVVDDSKPTRRVFCRMLEMIATTLGIEIASTECSRGDAAVSTVKDAMQQDHPFHAVFIDQQMPGMSGSDATRAIRELNFKGRIICITGDSKVEKCNEFIKSGGNEVVVKPCNLEDIERIISTIDFDRQRSNNVDHIL